MRRSWAALLLALSVAGAAAPDSGELCSGDGWTALDESSSSVPEDVLNATLQAFDEGYVVGFAGPADELPAEARWVPCSPDERAATAAGCSRPAAAGSGDSGGGGGGTEYRLSVQLACKHTGHSDFANFTATLTDPGDGGDPQVRIPRDGVQLAVHEFHLTAPDCPIEDCLECKEAVDGEEPACEECIEGHSLEADGTCSPADLSDGAAALFDGRICEQQPLGWLGDACPCGWHYKPDGLGGWNCLPCTREGCSLREGRDCVACLPGVSQDCSDDGQWCRPPCAEGYSFRGTTSSQACIRCSQYLANCDECFACDPKKGQWCSPGGVACKRCAPGFYKCGDYSGICWPEGTSCEEKRQRGRYFVTS